MGTDIHLQRELRIHPASLANERRGIRVYPRSQAGVTIRVLGAIIGLLVLVSIAQAIPAGGAATGVASNNFTVPVAGAVGDTFVAWGRAPGHYNFASGTYTPDGGAVNVEVFGAPLLGGKTVYYVACDSTGCDPNERNVLIPDVTPIPTTTFGVYYYALSQSHFKIDQIAPNTIPAYTATGVSAIVMWGIMFMMIFMGIWFRTKSVRLPFILAMIVGAFILPIGSGLYLGAPITMQLVAQGLIPAALAGIIFAMIRK